MSDDGAAPEESVLPPPVPDRPEEPSAPAASGGYRFLTAAIFAFLLLLLGGAIALLVHLAANTSFSLPAADPEPVATAPVESPQDPAAPVDPASPAQPLTADECSEFCADLANRAGETVTGLDGGSVWALAKSWATAELATLPAEEAVGAAYESDAGRLDLLVWRFSDDESARDAFDRLAEDLGDPSDTGSVLNDGRGIQNTYFADGRRTILWTVLGDDAQPWVMEITGPDDEAVQQFYYALPF